MSEETRILIINQVKKIIALYILMLGIFYLDSQKSTGAYIILEAIIAVILWIIIVVISCSLLASIIPEIFHFLKWILIYPFKRQPYQSNVRLNAIKEKALAETRKREREEELQKNLQEAEIHLHEAAALSAEEAYRLGIRDGYDKGFKIGHRKGYYMGLETGEIRERNKK